MKLTGRRINAKPGACMLLPINKMFPPLVNSSFIPSCIQGKLALVIWGRNCYLGETTKNNWWRAGKVFKLTPAGRCGGLALRSQVARPLFFQIFLLLVHFSWTLLCIPVILKLCWVYVHARQKPSGEEWKFQPHESKMEGGVPRLWTAEREHTVIPDTSTSHCIPREVRRDRRHISGQGSKMASVNPKMLRDVSSWGGAQAAPLPWAPTTSLSPAHEALTILTLKLTGFS